MRTYRVATETDIPELAALMAAAIDVLQNDFLTHAQVKASRSVMGLDTQLVSDGTYFLVQQDGELAGCGGWSRRKTLYGGDHSISLRDETLLDPARDAARIRAMYTHPAFIRRGVGRFVLSLCENAAARAGFGTAELMATLSGEPLYRACGYVEIERIATAVTSDVSVPLIRMRKPLQPLN